MFQVWIAGWSAREGEWSSINQLQYLFLMRTLHFWVGVFSTPSTTHPGTRCSHRSESSSKLHLKVLPLSFTSFCFFLILGDIISVLYLPDSSPSFSDCSSRFEGCLDQGSLLCADRDSTCPPWLAPQELEINSCPQSSKKTVVKIAAIFSC